MKTRQLFKLLAIACSVSLVPGMANASDHGDGGPGAADPIADVLDLYAFMNPPCRVVNGSGCEDPPEELILALTIHRSATSQTRFSPSVSYKFHFENDVGVRTQIECRFDNAQQVTCEGLGGLSVTAPVGQVGVNGDLRVFAGLRDDPFFADTLALERIPLIGVQAFNPPGVDTLAGENVMAIVLGIGNAAFPRGSGATDSNGHPINVQKVWAASERLKTSINAGVTGSWYDPLLSGQGWVIERLASATGPGDFLFYFYGYEGTGERLWLLGLTPQIDEARFVVDVLRFEGAGFGDDFDPGSVANESVGTMTFDFADCDNVTITFESTDMDLDDFTVTARRLTNVGATNCVFSDVGQVDRVGRPLGSALITENRRGAYNIASEPSDWSALFGAELRAGLAAIDNADGNPGNAFYAPAVLGPVLADDRLKVDLEWSACLGVWGIELSELVPQPHTNDCGGRGLEENVVETWFSMLVSGFDPLYDDFVTANDKPFLQDFPFLAAPH